MKGDRPLDGLSKDWLGFTPVAQQVAQSLTNLASHNGLVIGLEGKWGSGKSSLLFLIEQELEKSNQQHNVSIIHFRPWLVGNRDALLSAFFSSLFERIESVSGQSSAKKALKSVGRKLHKFAAGLEKYGELAATVTDLVVPGSGKVAGDATKKIGAYAAGKAAPALPKLKTDLVKSLREIDHRFVVTIDDVDRLEPAEVIEVMRLARSVADFPNVIYLLCYDSDILAHGIKRATGIRNGHDYLEKIVQLVVPVPNPEEFQLRRWFAEELAQIATPTTQNMTNRLKTVIDFEGGRRLKTPRSVVRTLDALRFFWPPLAKANADLADAVWLQLIKNDNAALYRWIENYCAVSSAVSLGIGRVNEHERDKCLQELKRIDEQEKYFGDSTYRFAFCEQLPGCELHGWNDEEHFSLHKPVPHNERDQAIQDKRLKSPDHYRLYFAFAQPTHALTQSDFDEIWNSTKLQDQKPAADILKKWHANMLATTLSKAEIFLDRIREIARDALTSSQQTTLLLAFADAMDEAYHLRPFPRFTYDNIWDRAEKVFRHLAKQFDGQHRHEFIRQAFQRGRAIGWLTNIFRREAFAHRRYGARGEPESEWIFTEQDLDLITDIMVSRYKELPLAEILETPDAAEILSTWQHAGGKHDIAALLVDIDKNEKLLIALLQSLAGDVNSSNEGLYKILERNLVSRFIDYDVARNKLIAISEDNVNTELAFAAKQLLDALRRGERQR